MFILSDGHRTTCSLCVSHEEDFKGYEFIIYLKVVTPITGLDNKRFFQNIDKITRNLITRGLQCANFQSHIFKTVFYYSLIIQFMPSTRSLSLRRRAAHNLLYRHRTAARRRIYYTTRYIIPTAWSSVHYIK